EKNEPSIFNLVRLRAAKLHYDLGEKALNSEERINQANQLPFLVKINEKLSLINLRCNITVSDRLKREYSFEFVDQKRDCLLNDINSLSAGQKAILHLVF